MMRLLNHISKTFDYNLVQLNGGIRENAIAVSSEALLLISEEDVEAIKTDLDKFVSLLKKEYAGIEPELSMVADQIHSIVSPVGGDITLDGNHSGWAYNPDSGLLSLISKEYEELTGRKPAAEAIHAGLECGVFAGNIEGMDCVSIGPDMKNVHTDKERLSISSVERIYELLLSVLGRLGE